MIEIRIGDSHRDFDAFDESWANEQINRRRANGEEVCVEVVFDTEDLKFGLSSPVCTRAGGGNSRPLTSQEQAVIDLWGKHNLNANDFSGGNLVAFIKQLRKLI